MIPDQLTRRSILAGAAGAFATGSAAAQPPPTRGVTAIVEDYASLVTDDDWTAAIQKGMDDLAASGGGSLALRRRGFAHFYLSGTLYFRPKVLLDGGGRGHHAADGMAWLRPRGIPANGYLFDTDGRSGGGFGLIGVGAQGEREAGASGGIRIGHDAIGVAIWHSSFSDWSRHALLAHCGVSQFWHSFFSGWANRSLAAGKVAAFELSGADNMVCFSEIAGPSVRGVSHPTRLPIAAARFTGLGVSLIEGNIFECGDEGVSHMGDANRFIGNRYDTNAGHGLAARGTGNVSIGESFGRNSFADGGSNRYDHIYAPAGESGGNTFVAPQFYSHFRGDSTWAFPRYCINDQVVNAAWKNHYAWPGGVYAPTDNGDRPNYGTGFFNVPADGVDAAALTLKAEGPQRLQESATPSVLLHTMFTADAWSRPHSVTNFGDGVPGQRILVRGNGAGHLTLVAGENIRLGSLPSPYVLPETRMLELANIGGPGAGAVWQVIGA